MPQQLYSLPIKKKIKGLLLSFATREDVFPQWEGISVLKENMFHQLIASIKSKEALNITISARFPFYLKMHGLRIH